MRNLKKILAMALALVMSLSLMATAGAAETTAVSGTSQYQTAAEVLQGLKVIRGDENGFRFQDSITRVEAAALVYRIATSDVEDAQRDLYTNHPFSDVPAGYWGAGYISYGYNAEIIKGNGNGTVTPDEPVTGYATMAMILRTMGYGKNGEFEGDNWEIQTAAIAKREGLLDGVAATDEARLGQPAPRELVFKILFNALLNETVDFDARFPNVYPKTGETLGYKAFKLEELEGVVVANEFANLYGSSVLANGKTNLEIAKDDVRSLDVSTELTDMGERQHVYITGSTVLSMDNTGLNTVKENDGAAVVIDTTAKFQAAAGMPAASDIEYFVNFDRVGNYTCDQRLEFRVTFQNSTAMASFDTYAGVNISAVAAADNLDSTLDNNWTVSTGINNDDDATKLTTENPAGRLNAGAEDYIFNAGDYPVSFKKVIRAGNDISDADLAVIRGIFGVADNALTNTTSVWAKDQVTGDVFVGTKSTNSATDEERDLSNTIGYNKFFEEYINDEVYDKNWDRADNGEWVKFIDNDNDGKADYAFLTQSNLDEALSVYTRGDATITEYYTFSDDADNWYSVRYLDEVPSVGGVVLYTLIDGQYLVETAASETVTVTDYSWKEDQIITDKGTYGQSGIENWTEMMELISAMKDKTTYDVYFDHFGYIRAYELPNGTTYALVTEIYARNNANGNLQQEWPMTVELTIDGNDTAEYSLSNGGKNLFVSAAPWTRISNLAAVGDYYNWLQPAIAHLGVTRTGFGPGYSKTTSGFTAGNGTSTYWPDNRQVINNITAITDSTFDYGEQNYKNLTTGSWDVNQPATASFTNVAVVNIDGDTATLEGAAQLRTDNRNNVIYWPNSNNARYAVDYIQLSRGSVVKGQARYPIFGDAGDNTSYASVNNYYVNAVDTTKYYIVYNGGVYCFTGYSDMPALTADNRIHAAYAVARDTSADNSGEPYWVADVIVYEVENYAGATTSGVSLAYYNPSRNTDQIQLLDTLSDKAAPADVELVPENLSWNADGGQFNQYSGYGFYKLTNPSDAEDGRMSAKSLSPINNNGGGRNFNKNGIFAGTIVRVYVLAGSNYIDINTDGQVNSDGTLRTNVSLKLDNNIYSITEEVVNESTWNQITRNVAKNLRYDGRQGYVANSQVKPNDRVVWVGKAPTDGTVGSSNFIVDLGNDITAGDYANFDLHAITPDWLFNRTLAADDIEGEIPGGTHGNVIDITRDKSGLWAEIMAEQTTAAPTADKSILTGAKITITDKVTGETIHEQVLTNNNSTQAIDVTYSEWKAYDGNDVVITVTPANEDNKLSVNGSVFGKDGDSVSVDGAVAVASAVAEKVTVSTLGNTDASALLSSVLTITYVAGAKSATLGAAVTTDDVNKQDPTGYNTVGTHVDGQLTFDDTNPWYLDDYVNNFKPNDPKSSVKWTLTKANTYKIYAEWDGTKYIFSENAEFAGKQTNGIIDVYVEVKSEDGTITNIYQLWTDDNRDRANAVTKLQSYYDTYYTWTVRDGTIDGDVEAGQMPGVMAAMTQGMSNINSTSGTQAINTAEADAEAAMKAALVKALTNRLYELLGYHPLTEKQQQENPTLAVNLSFDATDVDLDSSGGGTPVDKKQRGLYFNNWDYENGEVHRKFMKDGFSSIGGAPISSATFDYIGSMWDYSAREISGYPDREAARNP